MGGQVVWGSPTDPSTWPKGDFDVVYDNNGKDLASCKPLIDMHMVSSLNGRTKHHDGTDLLCVLQSMMYASQYGCAVRIWQCVTCLVCIEQYFGHTT